LDQYKTALDQEMAKSSLYRTQLLACTRVAESKLSGLNSLIPGAQVKAQANNVEQMQRVVNSLTLMVGERDDEIDALKLMNRDLSTQMMEFTLKNR
jgi:hypothetical protein